MSVLLYGCNTWTVMKWLEKIHDGNYRRMLCVVLNKSWKQHPTKQKLYVCLYPVSQTVQVRWASHAGHCWQSKDELRSDVLLWTPTYGHINVRQQAKFYFMERTYQEWWPIGMDGEKISRESLLLACFDDDGDDDGCSWKICNYLHIYQPLPLGRIWHKINF